MNDIMIDDDLKSQILSELMELSQQYPPLQPGDITTNDIRDEKGMNRTTATNFMRRIVKDHPDKFEMLKVQWGDANTARWQWALRKK